MQKAFGEPQNSYLHCIGMQRDTHILLCVTRKNVFRVSKVHRTVQELLGSPRGATSSRQTQPSTALSWQMPTGIAAAYRSPPAMTHSYAPSCCLLSRYCGVTLHPCACLASPALKYNWKLPATRLCCAPCCCVVLDTPAMSHLAMVRQFVLSCSNCLSML